LFAMFAAPPEQSLEWSDAGVEGAHRFIKRLWRLVADHVATGTCAPATMARGDAAKDLRRKVHETIGKVGDDIGRRYTFNTAIAANMALCNAIGRFDGTGAEATAVRREALEAVVRMLAPVIPHVCDELWRALGHEDLLLDAAWPQADNDALKRDTLQIIIQVNGKMRGKIEIAADSDKDAIEAAALTEPNVQRFVDGQS